MTLLIVFLLLLVNFVIGIIFNVSYMEKVRQLAVNVNIGINGERYEGVIELSIPKSLKVFVMEYQLGIVDEGGNMVQVFSQSVNSEARKLTVSFPIRKHVQNWKISGFVNIKVKRWWIDRFMTLRF